MKSFDVVVVGGGHAGCEAALASARIGAKTAIITMGHHDFGVMPCNPSVGGVGKSHLVREIDCLGGQIGLTADASSLHSRRINASGGSAVRSTRVQCDKLKYSELMGAVIENQDDLTQIVDEVTDMLVEGECVSGVVCWRHGTVRAKCVVLCCGTFMGGTIHVGDSSWTSGRLGARSSHGIGKRLDSLGLISGTLKTGTPPRILTSSIEFCKAEVIQSEDPMPRLSSRSGGSMFHVEQSRTDTRRALPCHLVHTSEQTHDIIRRNLSRSSLYGGRIVGTGVRYCPSIEDKVVRFGEKSRHHVFLEPEEATYKTTYPSGLSNSMPEDVQIRIVHSIPALRNALIVRYGYAIEYLYCDPTNLHSSLETKAIGGLYLAGQINGTTGYEEAAAQGFIAGVNAARSVLNKNSVMLSRVNSYIGIMIDDLVTKGVDEPYRMFTSRSENRLELREDNARFRLDETAREIGICGASFMEETQRWRKLIDEEVDRLNGTTSHRGSLATLLASPGIRYASLPGARTDLPDEVVSEIESEIKYRGYIALEKKAHRRVAALESERIPESMDYERLSSLKTEARQKFGRALPATLGQASRIPGVTAADIAILAIAIRSRRYERRHESR